MFGIILLLAFSTYSLWIFTHSIPTKTRQHSVFDNVEFGNKSMGQKINRIAYLKVSKTGSSTLSCIFTRFGIRNNLKVFLYQNAFIDRRNQSFLLAQGHHFDIFATHTHYDHHFFTHIVRDPAIIGSVREPAKRIISQVFYSRKYKELQRKMGIPAQDFINEIVSNTSKYQLQNKITSYFGIYNETMGKNHIQQVLNKMNSEFLLVIVLEKVAESLVLLKRLLNWSFADIIYARKRTNNHQVVVLNENQTKHLRCTNNLEYEIYKFFSNELNRKIANAGNNFRGEVRHFKHILNETKVYCNTKTSIKDYVHTFPPSRWDGSFSINLQDCYMMFKMDLRKFKAGQLFL